MTTLLNQMPASSARWRNIFPAKCPLHGNSFTTETQRKPSVIKITPNEAVGKPPDTMFEVNMGGTFTIPEGEIVPYMQF